MKSKRFKHSLITRLLARPIAAERGQINASGISTCLCLAVVMGFMTIANSLRAITWGEQDGNRHPNVGAIVVKHPDGSASQWCSGTLIQEQVFLTAGHCTGPLLLGILQGTIPLENIYVSFAPANILDPSSWKKVKTVWVHPDFGAWNGYSDHNHDVGLLILEEPMVGITPANLPEVGYLDALKRSGAFRGGPKANLFTVVGYGSSVNPPPPKIVWDNTIRCVAQSGYLALNDTWLFMLQNRAAGFGGTGYGDSGGPTFYIDSNGRDVLVSITSMGDPKLVATGISFRIDTPDVLEFIYAMIAAEGLSLLHGL